MSRAVSSRLSDVGKVPCLPKSFRLSSLRAGSSGTHSGWKVSKGQCEPKACVTAHHCSIFRGMWADIKTQTLASRLVRAVAQVPFSSSRRTTPRHPVQPSPLYLGPYAPSLEPVEARCGGGELSQWTSAPWGLSASPRPGASGRWASAWWCHWVELQKVCAGPCSRHGHSPVGRQQEGRHHVTR